MSETVKRIKDVITFAEMQALKTVAVNMGNQAEKIVVSGKLADSIKLTRSTFVSALRLLEVTGIIETRSLGTKGTYIKVLSQEEFKQVASF